MASWSISGDKYQWQYRSRVWLEPTLPKVVHRSEVNVDVNQVIHKETIHIKCEPKIDRYCLTTLTSDGKITKMSQRIDYCTKYIFCKKTYFQTDKRRPILYGSEIKVRLAITKLTDVYHSQAIQIPPMNSHSDVTSDTFSDNDTMSKDSVDSPKFSRTPLAMSTPNVGRHLSERNPGIFENDSISYLYDPLDSLFSEDSTFSGDDVTDYQFTLYRNEVLILGLNNKKKRYANTTKLMKGILKKRPE